LTSRESSLLELRWASLLRPDCGVAYLSLAVYRGFYERSISGV